MKKKLPYLFIAILLVLLSTLTMVPQAHAQTFVHPGGLHTLADLNRMMEVFGEN